MKEQVVEEIRQSVLFFIWDHSAMVRASGS